MSDQFIGEVRIFAGNYAPKGWALCNGQLIPVSQNTALFSLLGTIYGGDGKSTFAVPDLQGRAPMNNGQGPGLSQRFVGENGGVDTVALNQAELPVHAHAMQAVLPSQFTVGNSNDPANNLLAAPAAGVAYVSPGAPVDMGNDLQAVGASSAHNNQQPFLTLTFIIALEGNFPVRP